MNKPRLVVETFTEVILALVLVTILGTSFWLGLNLNPIAEAPKTVLGVDTNKNPWEFLNSEQAVQKSLVASDTGFTAVYDLKYSGSAVNAYELFALNNFNKAPAKYLIRATLTAKDTEFYKLIGTVNAKDFTILDGHDSAKYQDISVEIPQDKSVIPAFKLTPYTEGTNLEVEFVVTKI